MPASTRFRDAFKIAKEVVNWYPGHMRNSLLHMQAKMRLVNCIIEVHDSRVPFTGRNPMFVKNLVGTKPHILVLTKVDLTDTQKCREIALEYREQGQEHLVFVNCLKQNCKGLKKLIPLATSLINKSTLMPDVECRNRIMVIGIPNVGKSSLINALRNINLHRGKATAVGAIAGVTKSLQNEIKVSETPPMYLIDTPGILFPNISDINCGMKLALCSCLNDDVVGIVNIADFFLYWMNKTNNFKYVDHFGIKEPIDDILPLLVKIAVDLNKMKKVKDMTNHTIKSVPDTNQAAHHLVKQFRKGVFGDINLDELPV